MPPVLPSITSPVDLRDLSIDQLEQLAGEMRQALCEVATTDTTPPFFGTTHHASRPSVDHVARGSPRSLD